MRLRNKIPESLQLNGDSNVGLDEYLQVCEEIFEDIKTTIKRHDDYKDYKYVPSTRLALLSARFEFRGSPLLTESLTRGIIRDLQNVYTTNGTRGALYWVFRLLGWKVKVENAWLLNPHLYFPSLPAPEYPDYPDGEGVYLQFGGISTSSDSLSDTLSFSQGYKIEEKGQSYYSNEQYIKRDNGHLLIGVNRFDGEISISTPSYKIEVEDQAYIPNDSLYMSGFPLIGLNFVSPVSDNQTRRPDDDFSRSYDYDKIGFRNFVYGEARDLPSGAYFYGRSFESVQENKQQLRIVGETYDKQTEWHSKEWVMSTPYLAITLTDEDYSKFKRTYTDEGESFEFNEGETDTLIEYLINYVFYELIRPSAVRILVLGETVTLRDSGTIEEITYEDTWTADPYPEEIYDDATFSEVQFSAVDVNLPPPTISLAPQCSPTGVNVSFTADPDAQGIRIFKDDTPAGDWSQKPIIHTTSNTTGSYLDTDIEPGKGYWYMVEVFFMDIGVDSEVVGSLADCVYEPPNVSSSLSCADNRVRINFTDTTGNSNGTKIYRATSSNRGSATLIHTTSNASGSFNDTDITNGDTYYYWMSSDFGGTEDLEVGPLVEEIDCVDDVSFGVSYVCGPTSIIIDYDVPVGEYSSFDIERSESSGGPWTSVYSSASAEASQFIDTNVDSGVMYYYRIRAVVVATGDAVISDIKSETPLCSDASISHFIQFTESPSDYRVQETGQRSSVDPDYFVPSHIRIGSNAFILDD